MPRCTTFMAYLSHPSWHQMNVNHMDLKPGLRPSCSYENANQFDNRASIC
uniref:Uncharacterized protein n=1 Tax=Anguilla anguilla TaxID=7936 RepID=A0A0E9XSJ5_ANGAN